MFNLEFSFIRFFFVGLLSVVFVSACAKKEDETPPIVAPKVVTAPVPPAAPIAAPPSPAAPGVQSAAPSAVAPAAGGQAKSTGQALGQTQHPASPAKASAAAPSQNPQDYFEQRAITSKDLVIPDSMQLPLENFHFMADGDIQQEYFTNPNGSKPSGSAVPIKCEYDEANDSLVVLAGSIGATGTSTGASTGASDALTFKLDMRVAGMFGSSGNSKGTKASEEVVKLYSRYHRAIQMFGSHIGAFSVSIGPRQIVKENGSTVVLPATVRYPIAMGSPCKAKMRVVADTELRGSIGCQNMTVHEDLYFSRSGGSTLSGSFACTMQLKKK